MKNAFFYILVILFLILVGTTAIIIISERKEAPNFKIEKIKNKEIENIEINETNISEIDNGKVKWKFKAKSIENNIEKAILKNISGEIFYKKNKVLIFNACLGNLSVKTRNLEILDGIELKYPAENVFLKLNNLHWNNSKNQLVGSKDISLLSKDIHLKAEKITFDKNLKVLHIFGDKIFIEIK